MLPKNFLNNPEFMKNMKMFFYPHILSIPTPSKLKQYTDAKNIPDLIIRGISPRNERDLKYFSGDFLKFCFQTADNYPWLKMSSLITDDALIISIFLENNVVILNFSSIEKEYCFQSCLHLSLGHTHISKYSQIDLDSFFKKFEDMFILDGLNKYFRA